MRERGLALLRALHKRDPKTTIPDYERIVVVGHSLGTIIGYDLIQIYWEQAGPTHHQPPMSGDKGVSISSMEGNLEITCKDGVLKMTAGQNVKINAQETIDVKAGQDIKMDGSSAKLTSQDNSNYDASSIEIA